MEENKDSKKRILKNSFKIVAYTTIILFVTIKALSFLSRTSPHTAQDDNGKKLADNDTSVVVRRNDSKEDSIKLLMGQLNKADHQLAVKSTAADTDAQRNLDVPINSINHKSLTTVKAHNLKVGGQKKVKKSLSGDSEAVKGEKSNAPAQKTTNPVQKQNDEGQKSTDPAQRHNDAGEKSADPVQKPADGGQKIINKSISVDETKNRSPNGNENSIPSSTKNVEFIDKSGRVSINSNIIDDGNYIPVREKASETSEMLGQFSLLAGKKGYLKFIRKSKEKAEIADGKKSFWYQVKIGDKIGYVFGYNLTEK